MNEVEKFWEKMKAEQPEFIYNEEKSAWDNSKMKELVKNTKLEKVEIFIINSFCLGYSSAKISDLNKEINKGEESLKKFDGAKK